MKVRKSGNVAQFAEEGIARFIRFPQIAMESKTIAKNGNKPLKAFRLEDVSVGIFANDREVKGEKVTFYNVSISKTYMKDGKLQRTQTYASSDIGKLRYLLEQAEDFVAVERGKTAGAALMK